MRTMKPTQAELYKPFEAFAGQLERLVKQEFNRLTLAGFDQLNVIRTAELTAQIYQKIDRFCRKHYEEICEWVYEWVYVQYGKDSPDKDWTKVVDRWLKGYDPVTRYVYGSELERKRLRLNEGILTAREYADRKMLTEAVRTAAGLILTQGMQYGLDLIGEMQEQAYQEADPESELLYHACDDNRTCDDCRECDGKIYKASEAPRIPQHYRCRCWYTQVK